MTYRRFEIMSLGVGAVAIGVTILMWLAPVPDPIEIAAQALLFVALLGAVHWGRTGGLLAALGATLVYVLLRMPDVTAMGMTPDILRLIVLRVAAYGLVGIVGGELSSRTKYLLARLRDDGSIDEESRVYNQRLIGRLLAGALGAHERYGTAFSVVLVELTPRADRQAREPHRDLTRMVADHIRNDIRLVDDVGRLDDGRFLVVLPSTPRSGAEVACSRILQGVREIVGGSTDSVRAASMGTPEDLDALKALSRDLGGLFEAGRTARASDSGRA